MRTFLEMSPYLLLLLLPLLFIGCWDRREPENRAYVLAAGFSYDDQKDLYKITVQVANPMAAQGGEDGGAGKNQVPVSVVSAKGHTPFEAAKNLTLYMTREPFFAHNKLVVFSQSLAERGIGPVMDYIMRDREMRLIAKPLVLVGDGITTLFRSQVPLEITPAEGLERQIVLSVIERAIFPGRSITEIATILPFPGREALIGRVMVHKPEEEDLIGANGAVRSIIHLGGGAVFRGDKMQGWFEERATRGWFFIQGRVKRATLNLLCPTHDKHPLSIEIHNVQTELKAIYEQGEPRVAVHIKAEGRIQNLTCSINILEENALTQSLNNRMAQVITNDIKTALEEAQRLKADVFGLGNLFFRQLPREWEMIKDDWDQLFLQLPLDIQVTANVRRAGLIREPIIQY